MKKQALDRLYEALIGIIQKATVKYIDSYSAKGTKTKLTELEPDHDLTYDHWVCVAMVVCKGIRISFRCHYSSKAARELASDRIKNTKLTPAQCHSYIKEYCNLVSGEVKSALTDVLADLFKAVEKPKMSLPKKKPSFDLGIPTSLPGKKSIWKLSWGENDLVFSSVIELEKKSIDLSYKEDLEQLIRGITTCQIADNGQVDWL